MREVEVLVEVKSNKEEALKELQQFQFQGIKKTLDVYFYDPLRLNLQPSEFGKLKAAFRLRSKDGKNFITYKVDHFEGLEWSHSDEYETEIKDFDVAMQVIEKLGLVELVRIGSEKHTYTTSEYEIVLEDVKGLGLFLEVENLSEVSDEKVGEVKKGIRTFLASLSVDLGEEQNAGKPELMLRKRS